MASTNAPASSSPAPAAAPTFKVFVGNLSFKTREQQLAAEFNAVSKVVTANIITRGPRSLGYGFVEFDTEAEAQKAVAAMNKKQIDGREINVEVAKPRAEGAAEPKSNGESAPRRGGFRGGFGGRGRRRGGAGGAPNFGGERTGEFTGRGRGGRGGFRGGRNTAPRNRPEAVAGEGERAPRTPSATTLFVANLPFSVDDQALTDIFKEFNPTGAHVVIKRNGRSKGFGFVEFKSAEDQQKALNAMDKKEVQSRPLIVRVAQQMEEKKEGSASPAAEKKEEKK